MFLLPGKPVLKILNQRPVPTPDVSENPSFIVLDGNWEFELKPTMNNQWGDFRLPVTEKMIGAEARIFRYSEENRRYKRMGTSRI